MIRDLGDELSRREAEDPGAGGGGGGVAGRGETSDPRCLEPLNAIGLVYLNRPSSVGNSEG